MPIILIQKILIVSTPFSLYKTDSHTASQPQTTLEVSVLHENAIITYPVASRKNYLLLKRGIEIFISFLFIVLVLSWLLPIVAVWIKLDSKGPVFFLQNRIGLNGKIFRCFKLRTMIKNDVADEKPAEENDHRITRAGRFLRQTNIDELPQFFNVFSGDMSLIGPRPHMIADCRRFSSVVLSYKFRSLVKPGITGLAQIKGYRGLAKDHESIVTRYYWDAVYVRKAGFWLDMKIIGKTIIRGIHNLTKVFADTIRQRKPLVTSGNTSL